MRHVQRNKSSMWLTALFPSSILECTPSATSRAPRHIVGGVVTVIGQPKWNYVIRVKMTITFGASTNLYCEFRVDLGDASCIKVWQHTQHNDVHKGHSQP